MKCYTLDKAISLILDSLLKRRIVHKRTFCVRGIEFRSNLAVVIGLTSLNTFIIVAIPTGLKFTTSCGFLLLNLVSCSTNSIALLLETNLKD